MSLNNGSLTNVEGEPLVSEYLLATELARNLVGVQGWNNLNGEAQAAIRGRVGRDIAMAKDHLANRQLSAEQQATLTSEMEKAEAFLHGLS